MAFFVTLATTTPAVKIKIVGNWDLRGFLLSPQRLQFFHSIVKEYLPPSERLVIETPLAKDIAKEASGEEPTDVKQDTAVLGNEGYEYKVVRRLKLRHRRDVSEIAPEYLPPTEDVVTDIPIEKSAELTQDSAVLANDGYQYKTVRRLKLRHRRAL